jgi:hypothetical protein
VTLRTTQILIESASELASINSPTRTQYANFDQMMSDPKSGGFFLKGIETFTWRDEKDPFLSASSFISLQKPTGESDMFTRWLTSFVLGIFHRICGVRAKTGRIIDEESQLTSYDDTVIDRISYNITTIIASAIPTITMLVLFEIHSIKGRIATAIGLAATFATFLVVFSVARRVEIVVATCA